MLQFIGNGSKKINIQMAYEPRQVRHETIVDYHLDLLTFSYAEELMHDKGFCNQNVDFRVICEHLSTLPSRSKIHVLS